MIQIGVKKLDTLYLDFDGTMVNTIKAIVHLYNEDFRYYKGFKKIDWWKVETWEFKECKMATPKYIDKYFNMPRFFENLEMMPWAEQVIYDLSNCYEIKIVSMGNQPNLTGKKKWLDRHFPGFEFIPIDLKKHTDKAHIDMSYGIIIDDSYENLKSSNAPKKICFGDEYEWNKKWKGARAANWMELKKILSKEENRYGA